MKKKKQIKKLKAKVKALELRLDSMQQKTVDIPSNPNSIIGPGTSLTEFLETTGQGKIKSKDIQRVVCGDPYKQPKGGLNLSTFVMCTKEQRDAEIKDILKKTDENCKNPASL